jgi:predicted aldo/keto reductase-like oxidoreductase
MSAKRILPNGDEIFPLGIGAMRLPTKNNVIDKDKAREFIFYAIDNGVNFIDTAYSYHGGASETFLGEILQETAPDGEKYRNKVRISTKLPSWMVHSKDQMEFYLNKQLEKLQVDYIDYYFIHNVNLDSLSKLESISLFEFFDESKASGKIKNAGFSYHGAREEFIPAVDMYDWDMTLVQFNYLDNRVQISRKEIDYAASKGIAVFIMEPLKGGILADNLPAEADSIFKEADSSRSPVDWALSWVLNHENVSCVLSGVGDLNQTRENIEIAGRVPPNSLTDDELKTIRKAKSIIRSLMKVGCTSCGYCLPCPQGINIPNCFSIYNNKYLFEEKGGMLSRAQLNYFSMLSGLFNKPSNAGLCNECRQCVSLCPQRIDIPKELKQVSKTFEFPGFKYFILFIKRFGLPLTNFATKFFNFFKAI